MGHRLLKPCPLPRAASVAADSSLVSARTIESHAAAGNPGSPAGPPGPQNALQPDLTPITALRRQRSLALPKPPSAAASRLPATT